MTGGRMRNLGMTQVVRFVKVPGEVCIRTRTYVMSGQENTGPNGSPRVE
jgi:hypothetical protein